MVKLSQSAVKDLENDKTCPTRWKAQWIDKSIVSPTTKAILYGKYFEQQCIGASAREDEEKAIIPLLKNGNKSVDHQRIDEQVGTFHRLFDPKDELYLGYTIIEVQHRLDNGKYSGVMDIWAIEEASGLHVDIDLKLTKDLEQTYGDYAWGNLDKRDYLQQSHYHRLFKELNGVDELKSILLVFDYSPEKRIKEITLDITDVAIEETELRFNAAEEVVDIYNTKSWPFLPSKGECENCPLVCDKRHQVGVNLTKETIVI